MYPEEGDVDLGKAPLTPFLGRGFGIWKYLSGKVSADTAWGGGADPGGVTGDREELFLFPDFGSIGMLGYPLALADERADADAEEAGVPFGGGRRGFTDLFACGGIGGCKLEETFLLVVLLAVEFSLRALLLGGLDCISN